MWKFFKFFRGKKTPSVPWPFYTGILWDIIVTLFLVFPNLKYSDLNTLGLKLFDQLPGSSSLQELPPVSSTADNGDLVLSLGSRLH